MMLNSFRGRLVQRDNLLFIKCSLMDLHLIQEAGSFASKSFQYSSCMLDIDSWINLCFNAIYQRQAVAVIPLRKKDT